MNAHKKKIIAPIIITAILILYYIKRKSGSHYIYENEKGDVISLPKSLNRMLWLGECKRHSLKGGKDVLSKISSRR